jgi:SSS family solute:Na+ symporter
LNPAVVVFIYLAIVVYIGIFAFRHSAHRREAEDYFLAGRSLGPFVFLMSLFGTNMTAFTILGSSGP